MGTESLAVVVALALGSGALLANAATTASADPPAKAQQQSGRWDASAAYTAHEPPAGHGEAGTVAQAAGPEIGFRGCAYFENEGFAGRRGELREGAQLEWVGRAWNDRISSVACHPGCRLVGYVDINYGGQRRNFAGAVASLGPAWNDRISALRSVCDGASAYH